MPSTDDKNLTLDQAEELALSLMAEHGLIDDGWRFRWSNAKRQLGRASIRKYQPSGTVPAVEIKTISLSSHLVQQNSAEEVRDTILHEIAHALAGLEHGHDEVWKATCRRIGAKPERLAGKGVRMVKPRYTIHCTSCRQDLQQRHNRVSSSVLSRAHCRICGPKSTGRLLLVDAAQISASPDSLQRETN